MVETSQATWEDPQPRPALGYCAGCLRNGIWMPAATLWQGTSCCVQCLITTAGAGEAARNIFEHEGGGNSAEGRVLELLRESTHRHTQEPGQYT